MQRISCYRDRVILLSETDPRNLLDLVSRRQAKKTMFLVRDPKISCTVFGDAMHRAARNAIYSNKSVILQMPECARRGDPNKKRNMMQLGGTGVPPQLLRDD